MSEATSSPGTRVIVLATGNTNKVVELKALLGDEWSVQSRPRDLPETVEDGESLYENAAKKANEVHEATGQAALADDTGLFVAALGGRPGVRSARYAGPGAEGSDNVGLLLAELADAVDRSAYFETVLVMIDRAGTETTVSGRIDGVIAAAPSGGSGFGYDPVFIPDGGNGQTFAEMTATEKNACSHRARALHSLVERLAGGQPAPCD